MLACIFLLDSQWPPRYALPVSWALCVVKWHNWIEESQKLTGTCKSSSAMAVPLLCCVLCTSEIGTAGKKSHPGLWPVPLHLQSANCHGDEKALLQCGYREATSGACNQGSAVVTCVPPEGNSPCFLHQCW